MMRAWAGSLLRYRFPADAIVLVEKSLVNVNEVLLDKLDAAVVVLPVMGPGGINVPTRLLMAARIISEETANVPEKNRIERSLTCSKGKYRIDLTDAQVS